MAQRPMTGRTDTMAKYVVDDGKVRLTELEAEFISQCTNEWGWLNDNDVDLTDYYMSHANFDECGARIVAGYAKGAIKAGLEQKNVIYFEESRPEDEGGDLYAIASEFEYLFTEA